MNWEVKAPGCRHGDTSAFGVVECSVRWPGRDEAGRWSGQAVQCAFDPSGCQRDLLQMWARRHSLDISAENPGMRVD